MQERDTELILRSRAGDTDALEELLEIYRPLVMSRASSYRVKGLDIDDFAQEAMIGLYQAISTYDPARGTPFAALAETTVENRLIDRWRKAKRDKDKAIQEALSLETPVTDDREVTLGQTLEADSDPEDLVLAAERFRQVMDFFEAELSAYEQQVAKARMRGQSYKEIATELGRREKSIDAALQRVRRKLRAHMDDSKQ